MHASADHSETFSFSRVASKIPKRERDFGDFILSVCSKNSIWLLLNECKISSRTEARALDTPVSPRSSLWKNTALTVVPLSGLRLCRFLGAALHILLASVGNLLFLDRAWRIAGLGRLLIDLNRLGAVLLMVPRLRTRSDADRCRPRCGRQDAVDRAAGLPKTSDASLPRVTLEPALDRCPPMVQAILLDVASDPSDAAAPAAG